jgi:hypothetical protein
MDFSVRPAHQKRPFFSSGSSELYFQASPSRFAQVQSSLATVRPSDSVMSSTVTERRSTRLPKDFVTRSNRP